MRCTTSILTMAILAASALAQPSKPPFEMPTPAGWQNETIALPPAFAKEMTWKGIEELRFAPGMFKADSDTFFSYALVFWLSDDPKVDLQTMEKELLAYYRGLANAVLESKKQRVDVSTFSLSLKSNPQANGKRPTGESFDVVIGELKWIEPFVSGKTQTLRLEIYTWRSDKHKRLAVFACVSPHAEKAEVWKTLREIRDGFKTP